MSISFITDKSIQFLGEVYMILFHLQAETQKEGEKHRASAMSVCRTIEGRLTDVEILALLHSVNIKAEIGFWQSDTLRNI
jgi:hypothetical protein